MVLRDALDAVPNHRRSQGRRQTQYIHSISDLTGIIQQHLTHEVTLYYRGESKCYPRVTPRIMRDDKLLESESIMLDELMRDRPEDFKESPTAFTQLMTAQHHGLPTRLLDVSKNPLVALFFGCVDNPTEDGRIIIFPLPNDVNGLVISHNSYYAALVANYAKLPHKDKHGVGGFAEVLRVQEFPSTSSPVIYQELPPLLHLNHLISLDHPPDNPTWSQSDRLEMQVGFLSEIFAIEPPQSIERVRAQASAFLTSGIMTDFGDIESLEMREGVTISGRTASKPPTILVVPKNRKSIILTELELFHITKRTLFPSLDTSAETIMQKYQNR